PARGRAPFRVGRRLSQRMARRGVAVAAELGRLLAARPLRACSAGRDRHGFQPRRLAGALRDWRRRMTSRILFLALATALLGGAGGASAAAKPASPPSSGGARMPSAHDKSYSYDLADQSVIRPITRVTDPALLVRKITR